MAEGFMSFFLILLSGNIVWLFMKAKLILLNDKLKKKDELIETMILSLPKLIGKDQKDIDLLVLSDVSCDSSHIKVKFECADKDFVSKLYYYLSSLQHYGYKVSVDYLNGTTKYRAIKRQLSSMP